MMSDENIIKQPTISQTFTIQQLEKMAEMLLQKSGFKDKSN